MSGKLSHPRVVEGVGARNVSEVRGPGGFVGIKRDRQGYITVLASSKDRKVRLGLQDRAGVKELNCHPSKLQAPAARYVAGGR